MALALLSLSPVACSTSSRMVGGSSEAHEVTGLGYEDDRCGTEGAGCRGGSDPVLVANPDAAEYLVLWQAEYRPSDAKLYGRRLDATTGEPIGEPVVLATFGDGAVSVAAAYDEARRRYVVAWMSAPGRPVQTGRPEVLELSAGLETMGRLTLPESPTGALSLSLGPAGRGLIAGIGLGVGLDPRLDLIPFSGSRETARALTLARAQDPEAVRGALAQGPASRRHLLVSFRTTWDVYQRPGVPRFATRLMNGRGGVVTTASFAGPYGTVPVRVVAAFNPRRSEYLVVWFAWRPGSVRELLAQRLDARGRAIGDRLKIAPLPPGIPSIVALDASTSSGGYMISWSVDREGWMRLVDPDRPSSHAPRKVFDTSQWDAGYTAVAATNARAGTSAHAWTQGNGDSDGPKVYVRVVARKHH